VTLSGLSRSAKYLIGALLVLGSAVGGDGATWYMARKTVAEQRQEAIQRTNTTVTGLAGIYADQINRQIIALDQTLDMMVKDWSADPRRFNLETSRAASNVLAGISRDMFLTDENGIIRQSSVPEFIGQSAADLDVFRDAAEHANDRPKLYLGGAAVNPIMRQWHLDAARTLYHPDGSFAGIIDADYRLSAITGVFEAASPGQGGFAALVGLTDGKLRGTSGPAGTTPDSNIADTPMFAAVDATESGLWTGPSASDAITRVHAFRRVPGRDLSVIAGLDQQEAMRPVTIWERQSRIFAAAITVLTVMIVALLGSALRRARQRAATARDNQANLAAANALAEVARAQGEATARRLQGTFAAITEGVAIFDAHLNLVEWNALFPERSGVNASFIRTGMPMEDVLRTQAAAGYFGETVDVDAEVERRTVLLRAGNFGSSQSFMAAGHAIELRCRPLTEGGFVALYTDVTETRRARQGLRDARDAADHERSARSRFLGVISHELHERAATLLRSIGWLSAAAPAEARRRALDRVWRAARSVAALATDTVEVPRMEAGALVPRPALVAMRPLLRDIVDAMQPEAQDRGLTVYLIVSEAAPAELIADPARLSQTVTLLLTEAIRFAAPDTMWLLADADEASAGEDAEAVALRVTIRGFGAPIPEAPHAAMFRSFDEIAAPDAENSTSAAGTGLGLATARYLSLQMGGHLRCESWSTEDGRTGNDFILELPPGLLPGHGPTGSKPSPRTRVLLVGAQTGLRMAAATMLRREGHMVEVVTTGEDAVRALETAPYDIVFIDSALSGMTLERAAIAIRDLVGPARTMPIIAIAPPYEETQARIWRHAGVEEILAEPPSMDDLANAIGRHVWLSGSPGLGFGLIGWQEETEEGIPILAADRIAELRANIPAAELIDMVEECIADLFHRLPAFRRALAAGAPGALLAQTHAMVGMAGGYGMAVLEARLRAILNAVRERRLGTIDGAATVVEADLTRAAAALRRVLRQNQPASSGVQT
jgi:signal transduction histidine kinase/CheY-like chemotaxis protein